MAFLLLAIGIFWIFQSEKPSDSGRSPVLDAFSTGTPTPTATPESGVSYIVRADGTVIAAPEQGTEQNPPSAAPPGLLLPTEIPATALTPVPTPVVTITPTLPPTPTIEPTATPEPAYAKEGEFRSDSGTSLNVVVKWKILPPEASGYRLQLDVFVESYALYTVNGMNDTIFTVNDEIIYGNSSAVSTDTLFLQQNPICSAVFSPKPGNANVSVKWFFNGSYSGTAINDIVAKGTIYIPG